MKIDEIRREIVLEAPIERVWNALTTATELSQWFGDSASLDLRPGGRAKFGWSEFDDAVEAIIEVVEEPKRFSFRWESVRDIPVEEASTLVEFNLEETGTGTRLTMVESGFAGLPEQHYQHRFEENSSGWDSELADLERYLTGVSAVG